MGTRRADVQWTPTRSCPSDSGSSFSTPEPKCNDASVVRHVGSRPDRVLPRRREDGSESECEQGHEGDRSADSRRTGANGSIGVRALDGRSSSRLKQMTAAGGTLPVIVADPRSS